MKSIPWHIFEKWPSDMIGLSGKHPASSDSNSELLSRDSLRDTLPKKLFFLHLPSGSEPLRVGREAHFQGHLVL